MIHGSMHGFMKFGDGRYKSCSRSDVDIPGPVLHHPAVEVDKPLTRDVVADEDYGKGCATNGGAEDVVHVRIPVQTLGIQPS